MFSKNYKNILKRLSHSERDCVKNNLDSAIYFFLLYLNIYLHNKMINQDCPFNLLRMG